VYSGSKRVLISIPRFRGDAVRILQRRVLSEKSCPCKFDCRMFHVFYGVKKTEYEWIMLIIISAVG